MIDELHVSNVGIITDTVIAPGPGLVAVTGETGAGKTLLLGALRMLRGDTASPDRIGPHAEEASIEGRFVIGDTETVARRVLTASRSRAYLDGSMVPAKSLTERFDGVIEIVAQHEHIGLGRETTLRALVDGVHGDDTATRAYADAHAELVALREESKALGGDHRALAREADLLRHQVSEIEGAGISPDEDDSLADDLRRLRHAGEITESLAAALTSIEDEHRAADHMRAALDELRNAAKLDPELDGLAGRAEGVIADLDEIISDVRRGRDAIDLDPEALGRAETRAAVLADLKRKYGATIDEVLAYASDARQRAAQLEDTLARSESISAEMAAARQRAVETGRDLADARRSAASTLTDRATALLRDLGFRDPVLRLVIEDTEPGPAGADRLTLEFASDSALTPGPVAKVASGGELSRLVLAVRVAAGAADAPVVAFDEVDAGVGGTTALAMGQQLSALARTGQVLVVTHLPQVAAFADRHYVVDRSGPSAAVREVTDTERVTELARMLGGIEESERGKLHAEELLSLAAERKGT